MFGQSDSSAYSHINLDLKEVSFVTSYYQQDGNNSAVTGGIGTEKLSDFSNNFSVTLRQTAPSGRTSDLTVSCGVDVYTSASSDNIDNIPTSPSRSDTRVYPQVTFASTNPSETQGYSLNASASTEYDYLSFGIGGGWWTQSQSKNSLFSVEAQVFLDSWKYILAQELRPPGYGSGSEDGGAVDRKARNSFNLALVYNQVLTRRFEISLLATPGIQSGLLSTPFHRVYDENLLVQTEELPGMRMKLPLGIRAHYYLGSSMIIRSHYRFYVDDWGVQAHTVNLEIPIKVTPTISISPYGRVHTQTQADYYAPYAQHAAGTEFRTSDIDLSTLQSAMVGVHFRYQSVNGFFGIPNWNQLEIRTGYYSQSRGLNSQIISFATAYKM